MREWGEGYTVGGGGGGKEGQVERKKVMCMKTSWFRGGIFIFVYYYSQYFRHMRV